MGNNAYKAKKHPFAKSTAIVDKICEPIFQWLDVQLFAHAMVFPDNSYTGAITNNRAIQRCLLNTECHKYIDLACNFNNLSNCTIVSNIEDLHWNMPEELKSKLIARLLANNSKYQVYIAIKTPHLFESFWFTMNSNSSCNKLIKNYNKLYYFILHYKEQIHKNKELGGIYKKLSFNLNHKNIKPNFKCCHNNSTRNNKFTRTIDCKCFYFPGFLPEEYLTKQQIKCINYMMLERRTAKATGQLLNISHRTVERHMNGIRKKFSNKFADLLYQIMQIKDLL